MKYNQRGQIIFSSFELDICTLIKIYYCKQSYVFLLHLNPALNGHIKKVHCGKGMPRRFDQDSQIASIFQIFPNLLDFLNFPNLPKLPSLQNLQNLQNLQKSMNSSKSTKSSTSFWAAFNHLTMSCNKFYLV